MRRHVCCALCGVLASDPEWPEYSDLDEADAGENIGSGDTNYMPREEYEWLGDVCILGEDINSELLEGDAFLTGRVIHQEYGVYEAADGEIFPDGNSYISTYTNSPDEALAFPIHSQCYDQLCLALSPHVVDLDVLFATFRTLSNEGYGNCLMLDYGRYRMEPYRCAETGSRDLMTSPSSDPKLIQYYRALIRDSPPAQEQRAVVESQIRHGSGGTSDPFDNLSPELLLRIVDFLDTPSVGRWRESSRPVARLTLGNGFWRFRIYHDMPWLYDFPIDQDTSNQSIDWPSLYHTLGRASSRSAKISRQHEQRQRERAALGATPKHGRQKQRYDKNAIIDWSDVNPKLLNRNRIWGVIDHILVQYRPRKAEKDRAR